METGGRQGDRLRKHLRCVERNDKDAPKPVAGHFNLHYHSKKYMAVCGLSPHLGSSESRQNLEQTFIFQIGTLNPNGINERFSFNQFLFGLFDSLPKITTCDWYQMVHFPLT